MDALPSLLKQINHLASSVGYTAEIDSMSRLHGRPDQVRVVFGEVTWSFPHAYLSFGMDNYHAPAEQIFSARSPINVQSRRARTEAFPRNQRELCIATAWRLAQRGRTVRICCSNEGSVAAFASAIVSAHREGMLPPLANSDPNAMRALLQQVENRFGPSSATLKCLRLGVALDDGSFPAKYWDELQRLLQAKTIGIVIAPEIRGRPAVSVSALVFHSLGRRGKITSQASFNGTVKRHIKTCDREDMTVLFPSFSSVDNKTELHRQYSRNYTKPVANDELLPLAISLLCRVRRLLRGELPRLVTYFGEEGNPWKFPEIPNERQSKRRRARTDWDRCLAALDKAILDVDEVIVDPTAAVSELVGMVIRQSDTALPAEVCEIIRSLFVARVHFIRKICSQSVAADSDTDIQVPLADLYEQQLADDRENLRYRQLAFSSADSVRSTWQLRLEADSAAQ